MKRKLNKTANGLLLITLAVSLISMLNRYVIQVFQVVGYSMEPNLHNHESLIMRKFGGIERFDIVVFPDPSGDKESYVKRIIGLPGENIEYYDNTLYINGEVVYESFYTNEEASMYKGEDFTLWEIVGVEEIPEGYYFVLGDNRPDSKDSRQFGLVEESSIEGVVILEKGR